MESTALKMTQEEPEKATISTTLRELIEVIAEDAGPDEDPLAAAIILDLLETSRIRFAEPRGAVKILWFQ
jgi:hypothetical protein